MIKLTQEEVDWFFNCRECSFKDRKKAKEICNLRLQGLTYREIGEKVGLSTDRARAYVVKVQKAYMRYLRVLEHGRRYNY